MNQFRKTVLSNTLLMLIMQLGGFSAQFRFNTFAIAAFMRATSTIRTAVICHWFGICFDRICRANARLM